jgi:hypothetical protein
MSDNPCNCCMLLGRHNLKHGRRDHSSFTSRTSHLDQPAMIVRLHIKINLLETHSNIRCGSVSIRPQWLHRSNAARRMDAIRSFFGVSAWIAISYIDFSWFGIGELCKFCQTKSHWVSGCLRIMHMLFPFCGDGVHNAQYPIHSLLKVSNTLLPSGRAMYAIHFA